MKHFYSSFIVTIVGLAIAFFYQGFEALYIAFLLAILEVSLSFDNAVVNAKVLNTMEPVWQKRFIIFGIPIAVFGMRFLFPVLIVSIVGSIGFLETFDLALNDPHQYHEILSSKEHIIFAFGGAFLLMVFLAFFFEGEKEVKWIEIIENSRFVNRFSTVQNIELTVAISIGLIIVFETSDYTVAVAYFSGILLHSILSVVDDLFSTNSVKNGLVGFIYLEVLDASFSFDGVIGAFALSSNIFIIMIGLGIGAMFVRSLTLYFVEKKTLSEFIYLEHGAHYAIGALAGIMLIKIFHVHISEVVTGTIGILLISIAFGHSLYARKKESK
jgi:hypothetical protein